MKKKFLSMAIVALLISALAGCGNNQKQAESSGDNIGVVTPDAKDDKAVVEQDTDDDNDQNTQNMISVADLKVGESMLTNENDGVSLARNTGDYTENTYYYYKDGSLQSIEIAHMYKDKDAAQKAYDSLKNDENAKKEYASIDVEDDTVYMLATQGKVDSFKSYNQPQLYDKLKSEHPEAKTDENTQQNNNNSENK